MTRGLNSSPRTAGVRRIRLGIRKATQRELEHVLIFVGFVGWTSTSGLPRRVTVLSGLACGGNPCGCLEQARKRDFQSSPSMRTHGPRDFRNQDKSRRLVVGMPPGPLSPPTIPATETTERYAARSERLYHPLT